MANMFGPIATLDEVFRTKKSPYYILTDPYRETSSGIRVLHSLCHILNCSGYESYVVCTGNGGSDNHEFHELWTPHLTGKIANDHYRSKRKPILIIPESGGDLEFGFGLVVRYVLNKPGFLCKRANNLEDGDLLVAYKQEFVGELDVAQLLTVPPCDPSIFKPSGLSAHDRHGRYFYFNRLGDFGGSLSAETQGAIEISPLKPRSLRELADIFGKAELLYCYEWGAIAAEARMCGCPVVCIPNARMLSSFDDETFGAEGVAWGTGEKEIVAAKATVDQYYPRYLAMFASFREQLVEFVERTQATAQRMDFDACYPPDYGGVREWSTAPGHPEESASSSASEPPTEPPKITELVKLLWSNILKRN